MRRVGATIVPNARALVVKQKTYMTLQRAVQMLDALVSTMRFNPRKALGFERRSEFAPPGGPVITTMWRNARSG